MSRAPRTSADGSSVVYAPPSPRHRAGPNRSDEKSRDAKIRWIDRTSVLSCADARPGTRTTAAHAHASSARRRRADLMRRSEIGLGEVIDRFGGGGTGSQDAVLPDRKGLRRRFTATSATRQKCPGDLPNAASVLAAVR